MQHRSALFREHSREDHARSAKDGSAMKIQCQSCQAKYTIADEKVLGKVVKIRCKKCSATIVINGNEQRPAEDNADTHVFDYASQSNEPWTVNVADGDQRTMSAQEIVAEYKAGTLNDETYCWKDGMADWLPLREIEQLYAAINLAPRPSLQDDVSIPPQSIPPQSVPPAAALFSAGEVDSAVDSPFAGAAHANGNGNGNGSAALFGGGNDATQAAPAAARRGGGRGQGADLFGNVAAAGGEEEVMTSAAGGGMAPAEDPKMTGQRNENSVLFSLSALTEGTAKPPEANRTTATGDGSGLIDIRALSQTMAGPDDRKDKGSRVDDIMNLSGGGAFGAALAAPILAPPPLEAVDMSASGGASGNQSKMLLIGILGGAALIAIGIVVAVVLTRSPEPVAKDGPAATATVPDGTGALALNEPAPEVTAAPADDDNTPPPPGTGNTATPTKPSGGGGGGKSTGGGGGTTKAATESAAPTPPPAPAKPADFGSALAQAAGKPKDEPKAATSSGSSAPFNRGAASAALSGVNVQACKKPGGPTGSGRVKVTFAPSGSVSAAVIEGPPFAGTPVGGCIAGKFRGANIPAFSGGPVSANKTFTIN
jgi:predicted Zn finger-like uncharacterized protein